MFIQSTDAVIASEDCRKLLVGAICRSLAAFKQSLALLGHRLLAYSQRDHARGSLLLLASSILEQAKGVLGQEQVLLLRDAVLQLPGVKDTTFHVLGKQSQLGKASCTSILVPI